MVSFNNHKESALDIHHGNQVMTGYNVVHVFPLSYMVKLFFTLDELFYPFAKEWCECIIPKVNYNCDKTNTNTLDNNQTSVYSLDNCEYFNFK